MAAGLRRILFNSALALGVVMVAGGAVIGYLGYEHSAGPDGAVRSYFAALQDGDAPRALAWGTVPAGPHTLLTSAVLKAQQQIAPIRDLRVGTIDMAGSRAVVHVRYTLAYGAGNVSVGAAVPVAEHDGDWRLRATAIPTQLVMSDAARRASVAGHRVPDSSTLLFPGAIPITFDSPYLELDPAQDSVGFGAEPEIDVAVQVSRAGRAAVQTAIGRALTACISSHPDVTCPIPSDRYVPGSLRGTLEGDTLQDLTITLGPSSNGVIKADGSVGFTGTYRKLTFANRAKPGRGTAHLKVHAKAYAVTPLAIIWTPS